MSHPHEWEDTIVISSMDGNGKFSWSKTELTCKRCGAHATREPGGFVGCRTSCDEVIVQKVLET